MTGRERIVAALNHKVSDRTPIDFGGHRSSGIMADVPPENVIAMFEAIK